MSSFDVLVRKIDDIYDHPNADRLSLVKVLGYEAVTAKAEDGSHRFRKGEYIVYVPEASVVPEDVLKEYGFWNTEKDMGLLAGKKGNRVKAIRLRGVLSQGLVFPTHPDSRDGISEDFSECFNGLVYVRRNGTEIAARLGDDLAEFFEITKYEPPIPVGMSGECVGAFEFAFNYDIENAQNFPGFLDNDEVEATEKLHGTNFRVTYHPVARHPDIFEGCVAVTSKGLGQKGIVFKDNEANANVLYVKMARELDLPAKVRTLGERLGKRIDLFGEIFGVGVQDLHYDTKKAEYRAFDIAIDGRFTGTDDKIALFAELGVERVPVLYRGPWDEAKLVLLRDGKTMLGGSNIREGIVVTATGDQASRLTNETHRLRPILKMVSPDYLTRKGETTEFN